MRRLPALLAVWMLLFGAANARGEDGRLQVIPLRHTDAAWMLDRIGKPLPKGIESAMPYDLTNSIVVVGTPEAVAGLRRAVEILDKPPAEVRVAAEIYELDLDALATDLFAGTDAPRKTGVFTGESADRVATAVQKVAAQGAARLLISPRAAAASGRAALIETKSAEGVFLAIRVVPEVRGKAIHADLLAVEGRKEGITYAGRAANVGVDTTPGGRAVLWLAPAADAPKDLVVVLRFVAAGQETLKPAPARP